MIPSSVPRVIFQEHDTNKTGTISVDQMSDIYRFYKVDNMNFISEIYISTQHPTAID